MCEGNPKVYLLENQDHLICFVWQMALVTGKSRKFGFFQGNTKNKKQRSQVLDID